MTVIVGIVHHSGLVMAADGEEATPTRTRSVSKLPVFQNSKGSSIIIGGAGPAYQTESVTEIIHKDFKDATEKNWNLVESRIKKTIRKHYNEHVLTWPSADEREDYDFSLLIGVALRDTKGRYSHFLMAAEKGSLRHVSPYYSVGIAESYAKSLIDEYLSLRPPLLVAMISIYVIHKIKSDTPHVGKETEVWTIEEGKVRPIMRPYVEEAEALFKKYEYAKVRYFLAVVEVSSFTAIDPRHDNSIQRELSSLREKFRELVDRIERPASSKT